LSLPFGKRAGNFHKEKKTAKATTGKKTKLFLTALLIIQKQAGKKTKSRLFWLCKKQKTTK
jgi:hypothetical protein